MKAGFVVIIRIIIIIIIPRRGPRNAWTGIREQQIWDEGWPGLMFMMIIMVIRNAADFPPSADDNDKRSEHNSSSGPRATRRE